MPTPSEHKALAFVAIVILLGGAVRVLRAGSTPAPTALEQQALANQASAADSAAARRPSKGAKSPKRGRSRRSAGDTLPVVVGGVRSVPPTFARPDRPFDHTPYATTNRLGFPPPSPRIETDARGIRVQPRAASPPSRNTGGEPRPDALIDMDAAPARDIEALPRIGPALARRIVASRDSLGPFGSLEGLQRVKGIGKATLQQLAPLVTFTGRPSSQTRP